MRNDRIPGRDTDFARKLHQMCLEEGTRVMGDFDGRADMVMALILALTDAMRPSKRRRAVSEASMRNDRIAALGEAVRPSLLEIAEHIPMGFSCRSCGGSAYNWLGRCGRYVETGATCCPNMREWVRRAEAGEETPRERMAKRDAERAQAAALAKARAEYAAWMTTWTRAPYGPTVACVHPLGQYALLAQEPSHVAD